MKKNMWKRISAIIICLMLSFSLLPFLTFKTQASTNGHSQADAVNYARGLVGTPWDVDNGSYDCVDILKKYFLEIGGQGYSPQGNAGAYATTATIPNGWQRMYMSNGYSPQPGDVAVWGFNAKMWNATISTGHVGIVVAVSGNTITLVDQDSTKQRAAAYNDYRASDVTCYIHPDFDSTPFNATVDRGQDGIYLTNDTVQFGVTSDKYSYYVLKIFHTPVGGSTYEYWEGQVSPYYSMSFSQPGYYSCSFYGNNSVESGWVGWRVIEPETTTVDKGDNGTYVFGEPVKMSVSPGVCDYYILKIFHTPVGGSTYEYWEGEIHSTEYTATFNQAGHYSCVFVGNNTVNSSWVGWDVIPPKGAPIEGGTQILSDGDYHIVSALDETKGMDVANGVPENGANIQLYSNVNDKSQVFTVKYLGDGYYSIIHKASGKSLDVDKASLDYGTNLKLYDYGGGDAQQWVIQPSSSSVYFNIRSKCNGLGIDVDQMSTNNGTNLKMWGCSESNTAQQWRFIAAGDWDSQTVPNGKYEIVPVVNYKECMDVEAASLDDGSNIYLWSRLRAANQLFNVTYKGDGYYEIADSNSGKVLDLFGGVALSGANVNIYSANGSAAQRWIIRKTSDGYFNIICKSGGLYIDVNDAAGTDGTNVQGNIGNGTNAQKWMFIHLHTLRKTPSNKATCTEDGNIAYWTCNACGKLFSDEAGITEITQKDTVVKATGHKWGEWAVVKEATATEDGMEERVCLNDPTHKETRVIEKKPDNRTGLYNFDGKWKYFENGVISKKTGIVQRPDNGKYYYVEKGVYKKSTGLAQRLDNKKWYYVENGVFSKKTGVAARISDGKLFYVKAGSYDKSFSGLAQGIGTETKYFMNKGQLNNVTGLYNADGTWRYFEGGVFTEANGIVQRPDNGKYYYVEKGVYKKLTGLAKSLADGKWYYVEKGVFSKKTGAAKQLTNGKWYYVQDGKYTKATGLAKRMDNNDWYYFKDGRLDSRYDGKATMIGEDGTEYDVVKGKMVP